MPEESPQRDSLLVTIRYVDRVQRGLGILLAAAGIGLMGMVVMCVIMIGIHAIIAIGGEEFSHETSRSPSQQRSRKQQKQPCQTQIVQAHLSIYNQ